MRKSDGPLIVGGLTAKDVVQQPKRRLSRWHRKAWTAKVYAENHEHWTAENAKKRGREAENKAADQHLAAAGIVFKKNT